MKKTVCVSDVVGIINRIAPFALAEEWDNSGLQVGDPSAQVLKIMVSLDPTPEALDAAAAESCSLLLTHHPLLFKPVQKLTPHDPCGALIFRAIRKEIAVISLHTNYDVAAGGLNDLLADCLGLPSVEPLQITGSEELVKITVFVPVGHEEGVMEALFRFGSVPGNYTDCSFRAPGIGTFQPQAGAQPFLGAEGKRSSVEEFRLELLIPKENLDAAVSAMKKAHPYEEPAFDLYPLLNRGVPRGLGRIGDLPSATTLSLFARMVRERLGAAGARYVGSPDRVIRRVALCGGSGVSLLRRAKFSGADVLVTGDVKYHEARDAEASGIALVDAGHFSTERLMIRGVADRVRAEFLRLGTPVEVVCFDGERDPFVYL